MMDREKSNTLASFQMYMASCTGNRQNTVYEYPVTISSADDLAAACVKDHVCTEFKENRRSSENFIRCHAIQADCDNDNTEDPAAWITPATVAERLPGVAFYAVTSRNCDKVKHPGEPGEKSARPRWHYYFPLRVAIPRIDIIRKIMARLLVLFPEFDRDGMKPAQFFFGHAEPKAEYYSGEKDIAQFLCDHPEITIAETPAEDKPAAQARSQAASGSEKEFLSKNLPDMLAAIPADDYDDWLRVGMALKAAGEDVSVWDEWSRSSAKYPGFNAIQKKWNSFKGGSGTGVTAGTIVRMAQENGWICPPEKRTGNTGKIEYIDPETGEIIQAALVRDQQTTETIKGIKTHPANPAAAAPANNEPATDPAAPWEPIKKGQDLPPFPLDMLPGWIKEYINDFAESTGISKDFCAACVLGAVSTVVCGHLQVHFNGTHYEPAQLYTVFVGRSGSMKSTAKKQFINPASAWMMERNKEAKEHNKSIDGEISNLQKDLSSERGKKNRQDDKQLAEIRAQIESHQREKRSLYPVPFTDVVPESIIRSMAETNGIATIAAAEGNIINVLTGRSYTQRGAAPNLDIFLAGYDGEPYHGIRVTSGEVELPRVNISILLAIQPSLLETLCRSSDANGRGLVQRFLIFAPAEPENSIDHTQQKSIDPQRVQAWNEHIRKIAARFMRPDETPVTMELYKDADAIIRECWNYAEQRIRERGPADEEGIIGWFSKYHGKALRLAALLTVLDEPQAQNIEKEYAEKAVAMLKEYFEPHYIGSFETAENLSKEHKAVISWIISNAKRTGNRDHFAERDLQQYIRQLEPFKSASAKRRSELVRDTLEDLKGLNYIRPLINDDKSRRGPQARTWQINPELFKK